VTDERRERFEAIFAEHFDVVLRFVVARVDAETAKDVTADTFLAAWRNLDDVSPRPRAWLLTVARRKVVDQYRASGRRDALRASLEFQVTPPADPADRVAGHDRVRAAFAGLDPKDQELLRLLAWDGLSRSEAAQVLGCSPGLFAVRLHRARRRLRDALDEQEPSERAPYPVAREIAR
jgi:RNA polymerase sigma-70 factor, ECF subfamily